MSGMLRNLLLGKINIESRSEYKYALLRAHLGLLLGSICFIYIFIDILSGVLVYIPWYLGGIVFSLFVIYQNRKKNYLLASIILLIAANMLVFLIASLEDSRGGAFFYFVATATTGMVVLNPISKKLGVLFIGISIILAFTAYYGVKLPIPAPDVDESYERISFSVNFLLGLMSSVLVLAFVMNRNSESESVLIANQEKLQGLTKELEKSKNRYALAVEGTKAGIYEWDIYKNRVFVSSRYKQLLGYNIKDDLQLDRETFAKMIHPNDRKKSMDILQNSFQDALSYQFEVRIKNRKGEYRWFLDSGIVSKRNGKSYLAVGSIIDIHDRKMVEKQLLNKNLELEKTNEELDRFVYSASHDMRAPLSTLMGLLNLAKLSAKKEEINEYHEMMSNRINTMEGFIKEVTDYSRNTRLDVVPSKVNLKSLVSEVINSFDFLAEEAGLEFRIKVNQKLRIFCDEPRLRVVLNNLVSNAIKYSDPEKANRFVQIHTTVDNDHCIIAISDNGLGIPAEYQDKIFDMFYRASEKSDGSGLGLYIVKEIVYRLNGSIKCASEEKVGSTFEVKIPLDPSKRF